eukprot:TRINITY_DN52589_c0_g1_i1.p1 TRINITY_DN52589_c0_g1~~TRINITY_DN52589_c0_g1_i1.p1  ORF type:complete len:151 (+),score=63.71 TRINITY_DN52589_c0_g1_i1:97-549(+)
MADLMSQDQIQEFREAFLLFDSDGSGSISVDELGEVMRSVGQACGDDEIHRLIKEADMDNNGVIDFPEFLTIVAHRMEKTQDLDEDLKETFRFYDINGTGFISPSNLQYAMAKLGLRMTPEEADEMIREADLTGDGMMNFDEFRKMMVVN